MSREREQLLTRAKEMAAAGPSNDPPNSAVIDATLTHLIESEQNLDDAMELIHPASAEQLHTSVLGVEYQSPVA